MAKQIRKIGDDENFSPKNEFLGGRKVKATFSFRRDQNSDRYAKEMIFDFSGLSEDELLEMCLATAKVRAQAMLRTLDPNVMLNAETLATINVKADILDAPTKQSDPVSAAVRSMMKATGVDAATAREMLANAAAKVDAKKQEGKAKQAKAA